MLLCYFLLGLIRGQPGPPGSGEVAGGFAAPAPAAAAGNERNGFGVAAGVGLGARASRMEPVLRWSLL